MTLRGPQGGSAMGDQIEHEATCRLTIERWTRPTPSAGDVHGSYSRAAWLPAIGPTAWLIWGAITDGLSRGSRLDCSPEDLGRPWGYAPEDVTWALLQLVRYGLALPTGDDRWHVTTHCPPLPDRLVPAAAKPVQALHRRRRPSLWRTRLSVLWGSVALTFGGGQVLRRAYPWLGRHAGLLAGRSEAR
jgi:hypothetical protein